MTEGMLVRTPIPLTRVELTKMKVRALRRGLWFRVLSKVERASIDLTIRIVDRVRSLFLAKVLTSVMEKLLEAMESRVGRMTREVGQDLARKLSRIAQNWGNKSANHWTEDPNFMKYLTITYINTPEMFKA